jgi:hypothetical protein
VRNLQTQFQLQKKKNWEDAENDKQNHNKKSLIKLCTGKVMLEGQ